MPAALTKAQGLSPKASFDYIAAMRRSFARWLTVLIVTAVLCAYLAGNQAVGLFDRDEPRYAQTSRQMLASGDWVVPRFLNTVRTAKPVLIYWCQASAMRGLGDTRFAARLPSSLAMAATVGLLAVFVSRAAGRRRGLWTAFILGTCVMAIVSAKMCLTDAVLLLFVTTGQLCVYRLWRRGPDVVTLVVLGAAAGLAALTKGPVALGIHLTTLLVLWGCDWVFRRSTVATPNPEARHAAARAADGPVAPVEAISGSRRSVASTAANRFGQHFSQLSVRDVLLRYVVPGAVALVIFVSIVTPWLVLIQRRAPDFLSTAINRDVVDRMQRGAEGHSAPPGFYSVIVWGTFFPWSLLIPAALVWGWKRRRVPTVRFALAAWLGPWVMFELIATKLPHYVLPTYPALAFLVADLLVRAARGRVADLRAVAFRVAVGVWGVVVALAGVAVPLVLWQSHQADDRIVLGGAIAVGAVCVATGLIAAYRFATARTSAAARAMGGGTIAAVILLATLVLPNLPVLRLTRDIATVLNTHGGYGQPGVMIDFKEPSLAFEQGGGLIEQSDSDYFNTTAPATWPRWAVVTRRVWDKTRPDVRERWDEVGRVAGVAYSARGEKFEVIVLKKN